ncbi:MAG: O-antigen ligase family protein [Firmicutes bacterium]|nr:O-antigen ligase family protein [Bacillota bacterium]
MSVNGIESYRKSSARLLTVLAVFVCTRFIYTDFAIRQFIGYAFLAFFLVLGFTRSSTINRRKLPMIVFVLVIFACILLPNYNASKNNNAYMITLLLFVLYYAFSSPDTRELETVLNIFQITALVFAVCIIVFRILPNLYWSGIYRFLSDVTREEADKYVRRGYGIPIGGEYPYGNYVMSFGLMIGFSRCVVMKRHIFKHLAGMLVIAGGLLLSGRRSEPLMVIISMALLLFCRRKRKRSVDPRRLALVLIIIIVVIALVLAVSKTSYFGRITNTLQQLMERIDRIGFSETIQDAMGGGSGDLTSGRTTLWKLAFEAFLANPSTGIGWGQFVNIVPDSFNASHGRSRVSNVHNDYLQHFCECGVVMGALITLFTLYFLFKSWKVTWKTVRSDSNDILKTALLSSLGLQLFYAILGLIDPCFYNSSYWGFYTVAIALLTAAVRLKSVGSEQ